jgi:hypothetical protein
MKPFFILSIVMVLLLATGQPAIATDAPADLVQQVQAADLLADLITYTVDRADMRIKEARAFLQSISKLADYEKAKPNPPTPKPLNYMLLFRGSLVFVEGDGAKYADESVKDEPQTRLYEDLTAAQYYNMHEFLHFNELRREFASIKAYLESTGEYAHYLDYIRGNPSLANASATQPTPHTPEEVAQRLGEMIDFIHETQWKEAQAQGISRADFDKQWPEKVKQYRESVMANIEDTQPLDGGFGKTELAGTPAPSATEPAAAPQQPHYIYVTPQPDLGANRVLPPHVESPYSNADFRAKDLTLWNMWDYNRRY